MRPPRSARPPEDSGRQSPVPEQSSLTTSSDHGRSDSDQHFNKSDESNDEVRGNGVQMDKELGRLEDVYLEIRRLLVDERTHLIDLEIGRVLNGTHPDLVAGMADIENRKAVRRANAEARKRHATEAAVVVFNSRKLQAEREFVDARFHSRLNRVHEIHRTRQHIEFEQRNMDLEYSGLPQVVKPPCDRDIFNAEDLHRTHSRKRQFAIDLERIQFAFGQPALLPEPLRETEVRRDLEYIY